MHLKYTISHKFGMIEVTKFLYNQVSSNLHIKKHYGEISFSIY